MAINRTGTRFRVVGRNSGLDSELVNIAAEAAAAIARETRIDNVIHHLQDGLCYIQGRSVVMKNLYETIRKAAPTEARVLLIGESGAGKELAADALHRLSIRSDKPFLSVNCGAISPEIMESELFGHEKGAFTGATRTHNGYFERADGGTLFLDEITEMPPELQVKLLRILETGRFHRVGGEIEISVDVRIISATNRDPKSAVEQKLLREDLFFRLSQFPIEVPPLRNRPDDIPVLAEYFLGQINAIYKQDKIFSADALATLQQYAWPGNVRELKNAIERAYIIAGDMIETGHFSLDTMGVSSSSAGQMVAAAEPVHEDNQDVRISIGTSISDAEKTFILATLKRHNYDKPVTARVLGISLKTLYNKLKKYSEIN